MSPAKHSSGKCDRKVTDGRTDDGQSDPYVSLCFAGDTKMVTIFLYTTTRGTYLVDLTETLNLVPFESVILKAIHKVSISYSLNAHATF